MPSVPPAVAPARDRFSSSEVPTARHRLHGSRWLYAVAATLMLVVLLGAGLFFVRAVDVEEREYLAQNDAIARSVATAIEARERGYLDVLRSYASRFRFRESIKRLDA